MFSLRSKCEVCCSGFIAINRQTKPIHPLTRFGSIRDTTVTHNAVMVSVIMPYAIPDKGLRTFSWR